MRFLKYATIGSFEAGLLFRRGEFVARLDAGFHWFFDPLNQVHIDVVSRLEPWLVHDDLDQIVESGALKDAATVLDLQSHQRALVWIDNRFESILSPGLYAWWMGRKNVRVEVIDIRTTRFDHDDMHLISRSPWASYQLDITDVQRDHVGVLFIDGRFEETLAPGRYVFWKGASDAKVIEVDLRESMVDVGGQDIMTADKVTLRLNAVVTYRIADARKAVSKTDDVRQSLYRETQLVLRSLVGGRELDGLLVDKEAFAAELHQAVRVRAEDLGMQIVSVGVRDIILPGDMRDLMNKVMEAKRAAEANLISRREETAAMRSQANTARLLADNPVLMRLRELEVLEKIAAHGNISVVLGEKGLADKIVNLL